MLDMDMPVNIPADKLQAMSSSEIRKIRKPFVEKRRRERINTLLDELKALVLKDKLEQDQAKYEKADILELAVRHLKSVQQQQVHAVADSGPAVASRFQTGFRECAGEVTRYLAGAHGVTPDVTARLSGHLHQCLQKVANQTQTPPAVRLLTPPASSPVTSLPRDVTSPDHVLVKKETISMDTMTSQQLRVARALIPTNKHNVHVRDSPYAHAHHVNNVAYRTPSPVHRDENNNRVGPMRNNSRSERLWRPF